MHSILIIIYVICCCWPWPWIWKGRISRKKRLMFKGNRKKNSIQLLVNISNNWSQLGATVCLLQMKETGVSFLSQLLHLSTLFHHWIVCVYAIYNLHNENHVKPRTWSLTNKQRVQKIQHGIFCLTLYWKKVAKYFHIFFNIENEICASYSDCIPLLSREKGTPPQINLFFQWLLLTPENKL